MNAIYFVTLLAILLAGGQCQEKLAAESLDRVSIRPAPVYEGDNEEFDYDALQYSKSNALEREFDEGRDEAFDEEFLDEMKMPPQPSAAQVNAMEQQKEGLYKQALAGGINVKDVRLSSNLYLALANKYTWKPTKKCCPRAWNYGCRHVNYRLPCFRNYFHGRRETCCPIWPAVYTARCSCSTCHIRTSTCIHRGRCNSRYTRRNFVAVCYGRWSWNLRFFQKWIPSSCYCSARRGYEESNVKSCE